MFTPVRVAAGSERFRNFSEPCSKLADVRISSETPAYVFRPRPAAPDRTAVAAALEAMRAELEPWTYEGAWAPHRSLWLGQGFSDSPGASYENGADRSMTSGPLSLAGVRAPRLEFREHHRLESGYDKVRVEVQNLTDGRWKELEALSGTNLLSRRSYDLSAFEGANVRVRLRLTSDGSNTAAGITTGPLRIRGQGVSFTPEEQCRRSRQKLEALSPEAALAVHDLSRRVGGVTPALDLWPDLEPHLGQPDYSDRREALISLNARSARSAWRALESAPAAQVGSGVAHVGGLVQELGPAGAALLASLGAGASQAQRQQLIDLARREGIPGAAEAWPTLLPDQPGLAERLEVRELARLGAWEAGQLTALKLNETERKQVKSLLEAPAGWRPEGTWTRSGGGWDDSPGAHYANSSDLSLYVPVLDLSARHDTRLVFRESHRLESGYDQGLLQGSRDGQSWNTLQSYTGGAWMRKRSVDLSAYDGGPLHLRFRLTSDGSNTASGFRMGALRLESREGSQGVDDPSASLHARLLDCLAPAPDREARLSALAAAATGLHSLQEALELWDALPGGPELVPLASRLGSRAARQVWPDLARLGEADRARALGCVEDLRRNFAPPEVVRLWSALAPAADQPDFESRRSSLLSLVDQEGVTAALRRYGGLGAGTVERSVALNELARSLRPASSERLWQELVSSPVDPGVLGQLDGLVQDWRPEGTWARVRPASWGWRQVWQDSPGEKYANNANTSLTTPPLSLDGMKTARVRFWSSYGLENGYDSLRVEVSPDGGQSWKEVRNLTGTGLRAPREVNLDDYAGRTVRLRFRLTSDSSNSASGVSLGQLKVVGDNRSYVVDPRAEETREQLARFALDTPGELPALLEVAAAAGGTRNALALWPSLRAATPAQRSTLSGLTEVVGVEAALESWPGLQSCPERQLAGVVPAAQACPKGWSLLAPDVGSADLTERAAALNRLVHHLGEERAYQRWPALRDGQLGTLADRVEAEELAARLEGRAPGLDRDRLVTSGLGPQGSDALRELVGGRQETSLKAEDSWTRVRSPWWGFREVWQDSPSTPYKNNANSSLTSAPVSLADLSEPVLRFSEHHRLENGYDQVRVEISSDGHSWKQLDEITGRNLIARHKLDLSAFAGKRVQVRFRLTSDGSNTSSGISLRAPRIEARDASGDKVVLKLDELPLEDVTPFVELALDPKYSGAQRTSYLQFMNELSETHRAALLAFCAQHPSVSLAQAMNALLQSRLTSDPNDPKWLETALANLSSLLLSEQMVGETAENVTIGGVVLKKKSPEP